jgi:hypothetical protein
MLPFDRLPRIMIMHDLVKVGNISSGYSIRTGAAPRSLRAIRTFAELSPPIIPNAMVHSVYFVFMAQTP